MVSIDLDPYTLVIGLVIVLGLKNGINAVSKKTLETWLWLVYLKAAGKLGNAKLHALDDKTVQAININKERKSISAQDQYAKWTKLNRQYEKLTTEINVLNEELLTDKAVVVKYLSWVISLLTVVPIWFCRVWFRKKVLFYLPIGVFPYALERLLAFPFVVLGGVGLTVWMFSLNQVISSVIFLLTFPFEPPVEKPVKTPKIQEIN